MKNGTNIDLTSNLEITFVDVNLLCKFALMENQHGFSEQAQTLFEHILTSYPKRTDIWNVYVDMLVKSKKVDVAR